MENLHFLIYYTLMSQNQISKSSGTFLIKNSTKTPSLKSLVTYLSDKNHLQPHLCIINAITSITKEDSDFYEQNYSYADKIYTKIYC